MGATAVDGQGERRASWLELFFDLVLVAAIAALAEQLHRDPSVSGLLIFAGLFVPVWWAWWGFTWYSAAFNDDDTVNRIALLAAMGGVAALAAGVPGAAHADSTTFVVAYAALFALLAALYARAWRFPASRRLSARYVAGDALGAALWLASLALGEGARPVAWGVAMVVLMGAPVMAAASQSVLSYDARHIAERYGLFTLIVLGESVAVTALGLDTGASLAAVLVAILGLVLAATVWWLYFDRWQAMPAGGLRSGWVWAQGHLLVFAGIAAAAVGIEFAVEGASRGESLGLAERLSLCGGLAAYLVAMALIRAATRAADRVVALRAATGAALLVLAVPPGIAPLVLVALAVALVGVETLVDLRVAPPPAPRERTVLPHERARRRRG